MSQKPDKPRSPQDEHISKVGGWVIVSVLFLHLIGVIVSGPQFSFLGALGDIALGTVGTFAFIAIPFSIFAIVVAMIVRRR